MKKVNVAVIGVGHLGKYHAKICAENNDVNLIGVVDSNKENADKIAAEHNVKAFYDVDDVVAILDAAHVVVPTQYHHQKTAGYVIYSARINQPALYGVQRPMQQKS